GAARRRVVSLARLARLRVPLGFLFGAVALSLARPTPRSLAWGAAIAITGETLRLWAAGHLEKGREVTSSGPYRFIRHPLYAGSTLMGIGLAVASASLLVAVLVVAYLLTLITAAVRTEEAFLRSRFGETYDRYVSGEVGDRRFSLKRAIANREYRAVIGLTIVLAWLAWQTTA
ncbi:MAG: methyltransferase family protein, partial [Vicinamibacterales bacterium]